MEGAWHFLHYLLLKEKGNSITSPAFLCKILRYFHPVYPATIGVLAYLLGSLLLEMYPNIFNLMHWG